MTCLIKHVFQTKQKNKSQCLQHDYRNRTLTNHISCEFKCKCDGRECISSQSGAAINPKEHPVCKKDSIWNATTCECKNEKHLARMIDESVITFDEIMTAAAKFSDKETKTIPTKTILTKSSSTFFY